MAKRASYDPAFAKSIGFGEVSAPDSKSHSMAQDERIMARRNARRARSHRKKK